MADTSVSYKCPSCGAPLTFTGSEKIKCEYCDVEIKIEALTQLYQRKEEAAAKADEERKSKWDIDSVGNEWTQEEANKMRGYNCPDCGAEIVCDENTMATECCYCGNPTMIPHRFEGMLKPNYIIPFKVTKEEAKAKLKEFYKGKKLLPSNFSSENRIESIQGMYVPFWFFDAELKADAVFEATTTTITRSGDTTIREIDHYRCERSGHMKFNRVPVDGSKKMNDDYMDSIEPYDYSELVPFSTAYMAGYLADRYDVKAEECISRADERIIKTAVDTLKKSVVGYTAVAEDEHHIKKGESEIRYAMLPVWILTTKYQETPYTFIMNGQTGKFVGKLPIDETKKLVYTAGIFIIAVLILYQIIKAISG